MSESTPSRPCALLVAGDAVGISALRPAREMFDTFAVAWKEMLMPTAGAGSFDAAGLRAIIVASPDTALPAALAAATGLPVIRVPIPDAAHAPPDLLRDLGDDAEPGAPGESMAFATVAIGEAGAKNAALFVVSMLGLTDERLWAEWLAFRRRQTDAVLAHPPLEPL